MDYLAFRKMYNLALNISPSSSTEKKTNYNMRTKIAVFEMLSNLQVANYMNGGHYNPHHDYVMKEKNPEHVSCE